MNFDWISFLAGLIIGWVVEWLLDYFYWRNKRTGAEDIAALQEQLDAANARIGELESSLAAAQAESESWQRKYNDLDLKIADLETVQSDLATCRTNYADLEAEYAQLRGEYDDLQNLTNEARIRAIGRLTAIDGIDEAQAGRLYDAGIVSSDDLLITDDSAVQAALGLGDDAFKEWSNRVKASLAALGLTYAVSRSDDGPDADLAGRIITEEVLETYDFDEDGEVDLVVETMIEGLDVDGDSEIDIVLDETVTADILDEEAVAAAEAAMEEEIDAELEQMALDDHRTGAIPLAGLALIADDDAPAAAAVDDLTLIQGIGPRFSEKLQESGITTFVLLAAASDDDLDLAIQPQAWQKVDYDSWRSQARTFAAVPMVPMQGDDLQRIEGIGPKYSQMLRDHDILTFAELADTDPERLAEIIGAPAWRKVDYDAWITQAGLAAAGDEAGLAAMQSQLGRREGDNLLLIYGLGDRYNNALQDEGITTYADLAAKTPEEIEAMMVAAGLRRANFAAWIDEAKQRMAGKQVHHPKRSYENAIMVRCPQDLEAIEGVGTIYEQRLYKAGVGSYWEVAQLSDELLSDILEVMPFQDVDLAEIRASAMALALETGAVNQVWDGSEPDDFEVFEGIGEIYERRLYNAGICTYEALAAATAARLEEICRAPAFNKPDYGDWIATARRLSAARGVDEA